MGVRYAAGHSTICDAASDLMSLSLVVRLKYSSPLVAAVPDCYEIDVSSIYSSYQLIKPNPQDKMDEHHLNIDLNLKGKIDR